MYKPTEFIVPTLLICTLKRCKHVVSMLKTVVALHIKKLELSKYNMQYKHLAQLHWKFTRWTLDVSDVFAGGIICSDFMLMCPLIRECHHMRCAYGHLINVSRAFQLLTLKVSNQLQ